MSHLPLTYRILTPEKKGTVPRELFIPYQVVLFQARYCHVVVNILGFQTVECRGLGEGIRGRFGGDLPEKKGIVPRVIIIQGSWVRVPSLGRLFTTLGKLLYFDCFVLRMRRKRFLGRSCYRQINPIGA